MPDYPTPMFGHTRPQLGSSGDTHMEFETDDHGFFDALVDRRNAAAMHSVEAAI